jgi:hypothetical protein
MSIPSVLVADPYQASVAETVYAHKVAQPPLRSEWRVYTANGTNGAPSGNTSVFNIFPPSNTTIVDKRMLLRLTVDVTATSTTATNKSAQVALRSFPVNTFVNQSNIVINGSGGFVTQNNDLMHPLKRFIGEDEKRWYQSPTMLDPVPDLRTVIPNLDSSSSTGHASPFYGLSSQDNVGTATTVDNNTGENRSVSTRAAFPSSIPYVATDRKKTYVLTEPLFSGVTGSASSESGYVNVSKIDVTVIYEAELSRLVSSYAALAVAGDASIQAAPTIVVTKAELLVHYITPSITTIPSVFTTGFKQHVLNSQTIQGTTLTASTGAPRVLSFNNLTLNTVPEFLYIYVKTKKASITTITGEFTARITNVSINLGTSFGHLSQMDEQTLYLMSRDNGFKAGDYERWAKMGSVICIDCAKDLGLVPGQNRYLPIDFSVTANTFGQIDIADPEVCLISVIPGTINIAPDQCTSYLGFTAQDQGNAMNDNKITQTVMVPEMTTGSGMGDHGGKINWSGIWKNIKQGINYAAPILQTAASVTGNPMLASAAGAATAADQYANTIGSGYGRKRKMIGGGPLLG